MVVFGILSVARSKSGSPDRKAVARSRKAQYSPSLIKSPYRFGYGCFWYSVGCEKRKKYCKFDYIKIE